MAIDPRRRRPGQYEPKTAFRQVACAAGLAVVVQCASTSASAQALIAGNAGAPRDPWRFTPSIGIDEIWSDNINLAPPGSERSDFVTTISPALRVSRYGPRLTATFNYNPQFLYFARGSNGSTVRNYLDAAANATLIENLLFFDARVAIGQGNVSPFGTLAANSVNGSSNRAETRTYSLGPTLRSHFGSDLSYSAGYNFTGSTSNNSLYAANHTSVAFAQFESGTSFRNLGYGADVSRSDQSFGGSDQRIDSGSNRIVQETAGLTLTYVVLPTFKLRGRLGYDRNSYPTTGQPDLKGLSYSGGFDWAPSQHTRLNAQVGHRYFGPTANIVFNETHQRFAISALYSRDQTTSAGSGLTRVADPTYALVDSYFQTTVTDPALRAQAVANALSSFGLSTSPYSTASFLSNQLYLQKLAQLSVALLGLRNTVTLTASRNESQVLSSIDTGFDIFDDAQKFRTTNYSLNWSHKLGPLTNVNGTVSKIRNRALIGVGDTRQTQLLASVNRQIQRNLYGSLSYRYTRQDGNNTNNGVDLDTNFYSGAYRENAVFGTLRLFF